jgi:hypothetical protein
MTNKFDVDRKWDQDSEEQGIENTKKIASTDTETDEIEAIETTTIFAHFKKTGVILRIDNGLYLWWNQRYRDQDFVKNSQNHDL